MAQAADFQGMSSSPGRRWLRRTGAVLAGAPLLAGFLHLPSAGSAAAAPTATPAAAEAAQDASGPVSVSLDKVTPGVVTEDDTLTVSGTVTNTGKQAVTEARVDLRLGEALQTRSSIEEVSRRTAFQNGVEGQAVGGDHTAEFARLEPKVSQPFTITVPADELGLGGAGVYQFGASVSGRTADQPWAEQVLGIQRTVLPWQPEKGTSTRTTFLWPLISSVQMTAETDEQQAPVFLNDSLSREIAPGGRLDRMVSLGDRLDITWVVDPDLLAAVDAMADGSYQVKTEDGRTVAGTQQHETQANRWLAKLSSAVEDQEVVALPYGDPDLASVAHNGRNVSGTLNHLKEATGVAAETVRTILHVEPSTEYAWPVEGALDPAIKNVATSAGADKVIARSDSLKDDLSYTPSAARPIGGGTTAVVADAWLSTAFEGDLTRAENATLAVQKFLAQSVAITQQTNKDRSIVVAPQRMPSASQAQAMAEALTALREGSWSTPQTLAEAVEDDPDPRASTTVPPQSAYPSALRKKQLPREAFEQIAETQAKLDSFKVILSNEDRVVTPFGRAMNRAMSVSWRGHAGAAGDYRADVKAYLDDLADQVSLIDKSETKLSGHSATIPVTVQNNLVQGVEGLVLRLTSTNPSRLEIDGQKYDEQPISVSGGHSHSVKFTTSANANGPVTVVAQLYTEDGHAYGRSVAFDVRATEVTATVMLVIGGGVLILVLAGFRMYTQRKRAAARDEGDAEAAAGDEAGDGAGDGPDAPEQASDPRPDTSAESADPSATGEKVDR
ncbi:DUF6049 family protein [Streptomyces abyssomicinicus]|uniref:DUF6049 family protein n=1 Tax=Streptomyces abyssomicinicus TaxID=574929 RepID=UPI00125062B9|nr:DUF6049 family protein [Streptomyces abyssomicinicus]